MSYAILSKTRKKASITFMMNKKKANVLIARCLRRHPNRPTTCALHVAKDLYSL